MDVGHNHGINTDLFTIIPTVGENLDTPSPLEGMKVHQLHFAEYTLGSFEIRYTSLCYFAATRFGSFARL
jgi:hypothetical protein